MENLKTVFSYTTTYLSTDETACSNVTVFFLVTGIPAEMSQLNATIFIHCISPLALLLNFISQQH